MSIPPPTRPSSTPPSNNEGPDDKRSNKKFELPGKKGEQQKKEKDLFGLVAEGQVKEMKQNVEQSAAELKTEAADSITAKAQVTQVSQLIQRMVAQMQIGTAGGKTFASMELAKTAEVPEAFAGSNLTLSYQENGLVIRFDNFLTTQHQQNAVLLIESNRDKLTEMVQNLQSMKVKVAELNIGDRSIALPRVEPLPPPFQAQPGGPDTKREGGGERRGGRGPEAPPPPRRI